LVSCVPSCPDEYKRCRVLFQDHYEEVGEIAHVVVYEDGDARLFALWWNTEGEDSSYEFKPERINQRAFETLKAMWARKGEWD
jgi:hypothetical protein